MTLIADYNAAVENTPFRQQVAISVSRAVMNVMAGTPTVAQQALAKRFMLSPSAEVDRYVLPVAARIFINSGSFTSDANIDTAVLQVLTVNVSLAIS